MSHYTCPRCQAAEQAYTVLEEGRYYTHCAACGLNMLTKLISTLQQPQEQDKKIKQLTLV